MSLLEAQFNLHLTYRWGLYGFWGGVLFIGIGIRLVKLIFAEPHRPREGDVEDDTTLHDRKRRRGRPFTLLNSVTHSIRTNLIIPPAFGTHHQRLRWWCYIPTRLETSVILAYWILNLVLCCVSFETKDPYGSRVSVSFSTPAQVYRFIADRTGIMAFNNLPILWVFSLRNNSFMWLTGWSFSTFMTFHRHISRIVMIQVIVHASTYSAYQAAYNYLAASWKQHYWQMGAMAIIAMGVIHVSSSIYFRIKCYDLFLLTHIALSIVFIAGLFYHVEHFVGKYNPYIWPLVGVWVFDRSVRLLRLVYCNIGSLGGGIGNPAVATYHAESNLIRLEVSTGSSFLKLGPGQHYFLYQPLRWKGWESHPFTLAGWSTTKETAIESADVAVESFNREKGSTEKGPTSNATSPDATGILSSPSMDSPKHERNMSKGKRLTFLIRPRAGWTMRLRDECLKASSRSISAAILLEGPYGQPSPIHTFEHVVFIVGGSGITVALSYLQAHAERSASRSRRDGGSKVSSTRTRQITLIWAAKQTSMIREILDNELQPFSRREDVQMLLFDTSGQECSRGVEQDQQSEPADAQSAPRIASGRPNVKNEISRAINDLHTVSSPGSKIAVVACGPPAMADEARGAVHKALKEGENRVEYFEEKFGW